MSAPTCFVVVTHFGERVWHADDYAHAREQHNLAFAGEVDEEILDVYPVEHDPDCACLL